MALYLGAIPSIMGVPAWGMQYPSSGRDSFPISFILLAGRKSRFFDRFWLRNYQIFYSGVFTQKPHPSAGGNDHQSMLIGNHRAATDARAFNTGRRDRSDTCTEQQSLEQK